MAWPLEPQSDVGVEEVVHQREALDAMRWLAATTELVVLAREPSKGDVDTTAAQGGEQLLGLLDRTTPILLGVSIRARRHWA